MNKNVDFHDYCYLFQLCPKAPQPCPHKGVSVEKFDIFYIPTHVLHLYHVYRMFKIHIVSLTLRTNNELCHMKIEREK